MKVKRVEKGDKVCAPCAILPQQDGMIQSKTGWKPSGEIDKSGLMFIFSDNDCNTGGAFISDEELYALGYTRKGNGV